jgi:hypothetical protein
MLPNYLAKQTEAAIQQGQDDHYNELNEYLFQGRQH